MAETPRLPDDITAVLDRCVGEMRERLVKELECASDENRLEILARFRREIGSVRDKVSGRARIGISGKWVVIASLLSAIAGGAVASAVLSGDKPPTPPPAGAGECPPCPQAGGPPNSKKSDAESESAHPERLIPDYMGAVRDRATADRAAEGNQAVLERAKERLKELYLEAKTELETTADDDPDKSAREAEVKRLGEQLRKNGIDPGSVKPIDSSKSSDPVPGQAQKAGINARVPRDKTPPVDPKRSHLDEPI